MRSTVEKAMKEIAPWILDYPWQDPKMYSHWLSQQYHIVRHSTPMLALSCGRSLANPAYHKRCIEHLAEEKGHDRLLLNDLKNTGCSLEPELPATRAYYAAQYFQIEHVNTVSFLGYILFMEALAIYFGKDILRKAQSGSQGLSFLKLHAEEDEDHIEKAFLMIESLSETDQVQVHENLKLSARSYLTLMQDLQALASERNFKKPA